VAAESTKSRDCKGNETDVGATPHPLRVLLELGLLSMVVGGVAAAIIRLINLYIRRGHSTLCGSLCVNRLISPVIKEARRVVRQRLDAGLVNVAWGYSRHAGMTLPYAEKSTNSGSRSSESSFIACR
jgi:hypothetical protein